MRTSRGVVRGKRRTHEVQSPAPDQSGHPITTGGTSGSGASTSYVDSGDAATLAAAEAYTDAAIAALPASTVDRLTNATQAEVPSPAVGDFWVREAVAGTVELRYKCADGVVRTVHTFVY